MTKYLSAFTGPTPPQGGPGYVNISLIGEDNDRVKISMRGDPRRDEYFGPDASVEMSKGDLALLLLQAGKNLAEWAG